MIFLHLIFEHIFFSLVSSCWISPILYHLTWVLNNNNIWCLLLPFCSGVCMWVCTITCIYSFADVSIQNSTAPSRHAWFLCTYAMLYINVCLYVWFSRSRNTNLFQIDMQNVPVPPNLFDGEKEIRPELIRKTWLGRECIWLSLWLALDQQKERRLLSCAQFNEISG